MEIKLKKDWDVFKKGETASIDPETGVATFEYYSEDIGENTSTVESIKRGFTKKVIEENPDLFDILEDSEESSMKTRGQVEARLSQLYKDADLLRSLDTKFTNKYVKSIENMCYMLEWVLGNAE